MSERFFVETPIAGHRALLEGTEAHHLIHVMRAKAGQNVTVFDGSGAEFQAQILRIGRTEVEIEIASKSEIDRELPTALTLGVTLPKGDRQKWLIEKAVELGVTRIVPVRTERSVAQPVSQALERLRRTVIEASKQCGRNRLMLLAEPQDWQEFIEQAPHDAMRLLAHPKDRLPQPAAAEVKPRNGNGNGTRRHPICLAVGPEGGLTDTEVRLALAAGWQARDLGPRILRIETAALVMVAQALAGPSI